jgi:hypothetical protein
MFINNIDNKYYMEEYLKMIIEKYGTNQNKEENNFTLICDKCGGNNTRIVSTSHYENGDYSKHSKVTLELRCLSCGEKHICTIA